MKLLKPSLLALPALLLLTACGPRLSKKIEGQLQNEANLSPYSVSIENQRSTVFLSGTASDTQTRDRIEEIARTTEGVNRVYNNIEVDSAYNGAGTHAPSPRSQEVLSAIRQDRSIQSYDLEILVKGGTVYLDGRVADTSSRDRVAEIAEQQAGITRVVNRLEISRPDDGAIHSNLERLARSGSARSIQNFRFKVEDGEVVLRGQANRFQDVDQLLSEVNMISGIDQVTNQITVGGAKYSENWRHHS